MFMRNICVCVASIVLFLGLAAPAFAQIPQWKMVHGEVLQVLPDEHKLLLGYDGQEVYLSLEDGCRIFRQGKPAALESLRPVGPGAYQDALCWINARGVVSMILVNYYVQEEDGLLVAYDIFGNPK